LELHPLPQGDVPLNVGIQQQGLVAAQSVDHRREDALLKSGRNLGRIPFEARVHIELEVQCIGAFAYVVKIAIEEQIPPGKQRSGLPFESGGRLPAPGDRAQDSML
jgi:hypothetical protein